MLEPAVHPRMRGERDVAKIADARAGGSSPHARGTQPHIDVQRQGRRFIPACAGNARIAPPMVRASAVHPRMRGERNQRCATPTTSIGSSPHARGTRFESSARHHALSVHPRMRGERMMTMLNPCLINGSSPHARGTPLQWLRFLPALRFIPACAGNARPDDLVMHPPFGSSPHARGTRRGRGQERHRIRFIPACAGNARESMTFSSLLTVHPRMRGEREVLKKRVLVIDGSSPHARGTRLPGRSGGGRKRFIPACAGNALPISY